MLLRWGRPDEPDPVMGNPFTDDFEEFVRSSSERCQFCGDVTHDPESLQICTAAASTRYGPRRGDGLSEGRNERSTAGNDERQGGAA